MAKTINFNHGTLVSNKNVIHWDLPQKFVNAATLDEFDYLKQSRTFAIPLKDVERIEDYYRFTWELDDQYKPYMSLRRHNVLFKLKTSLQVVRIGERFANDDNLVTVFMPSNIFVDTFNNTRLLFYSNSIHLPYNGYFDKDRIEQVKNLVLLMFTTMSFEQIEAGTKEQIYSKAVKDEQEFVRQLLKTTNFEELQKVIEFEIDRVTDEQYSIIQAQHASNEKAKENPYKNKKVLFPLIGVSVLLFLSILLTSFFYTNAQGNLNAVKKLEKQEKLIKESAALNEQRFKAYESMSNNDVESVLKIMENIPQKQLTNSDKKLYYKALVESNQANDFMKKNPKEMYDLLGYMVESDMKKEITELTIDDPIILFEKAVAGNNKEEIISKISAIENPSDRQKDIVFQALLETNPIDARTYAVEQKNIDWEIQSIEKAIQDAEKQIKALTDSKEDDAIKKPKIDGLKQNLDSLNTQLAEVKKRKDGQ